MENNTEVWIQKEPVLPPSTKSSFFKKPVFWVILLIILIVLGGGAVVLAARSIQNPQSLSTVSPTQIPSVSPSEQFPDWKTYTNEEFGIIFKYPPTFGLNSDPLRVINFKHGDLLDDGVDAGLCPFPCYKSDLIKVRKSLDNGLIPHMGDTWSYKAKVIEIDGQNAFQTVYYNIYVQQFVIATSFVNEKGLFILEQYLSTDSLFDATRENLDRGSPSFNAFIDEYGEQIKEGKDMRASEDIKIHNQILSTVQYIDTTIKPTGIINIPNFVNYSTPSFSISYPKSWEREKTSFYDPNSLKSEQTPGGGFVEVSSRFVSVEATGFNESVKEFVDRMSESPGYGSELNRKNVTINGIQGEIYRAGGEGSEGYNIALSDGKQIFVINISTYYPSVDSTINQILSTFTFSQPTISSIPPPISP